MEGCHFWMSRILRGTDGSLVVGDAVDLELDFPGLRYKSMSNLSAYGSSRPYAESYAEDDMADVFVSENDVRDQLDHTLSLYFFDAGNHADEREAYVAIDGVYRSFVDFVSCCEVLYWDDVRQRRVRMYLVDAVSPVTDTLYGVMYKAVDFKFRNVFGRSFALDDDTPLVS